MKYLLLLLVLAGAGGGYYEFRLQAQHEADYRRALAGLSAQVDQLEPQNAKLASENAQLAATLLATRQQADDLTTKIHAAEPSPPPGSPGAPRRASAPSAPSPFGSQ